ncbi:RNA polymerase sigma factor [Streptomyces sp. NPDC017991]|uniref:RNA polymerase sigma factor n=1 Tax=Streptomyces sp. NPDC017991 TaxID=3365026 RepID=UPI003796511D
MSASTDGQGVPHASLETAFRVYRGELTGRAVKLLRQAQVPPSRLGADDVVQNAFVKALKTPDAIGQPRAYLHKIISRDVAAAGKRYRQQLEAEMTCGHDVLELGPYLDSDHARMVDDRLALTAYLKELPLEQRRALYLTKGVGLTYQETADRLGKRPGTVAAQVSTALTRLVVLTAAACTAGVAMVMIFATRELRPASKSPADPAQGYPPPAQPTYLGHSGTTWIALALLALALSALLYLALVLSRAIGARLPFLLLNFAKITTTHETHTLWEAELRAIITNPHRRRSAAYCQGIAFCIPRTIPAVMQAITAPLRWLRSARRPPDSHAHSWDPRRLTRPKAATAALCIGLLGAAVSFTVPLYGRVHDGGPLRPWAQSVQAGGLIVTMAMVIFMACMTVAFRIMDARARARRRVVERK